MGRRFHRNSIKAIKTHFEKRLEVPMCTIWNYKGINCDQLYNEIRVQDRT